MMNDEQFSTAPTLCTNPTKDANQQAASLVNWQQEYDQISNGRFLGQIRERRFNTVHVFREDSNRALRQQCRVEEGGVWLGISVEDKALHINHSQLDADKLLLRQGGVDFELITPEAFSIYGMVLKQGFVQQLKEQLELDDVKGQELYLSGLSERHIQQLKYYLGILLDPNQARWSCENASNGRQRCPDGTVFVKFAARSRAKSILSATSCDEPHSTIFGKSGLQNPNYRK